ncbi:hypothetical protein HJC23_008345 [Cyclotella cryptica]|uniref:Uncharacterized protein n=1 Tax=Cyclotella cryptica TaxID=29204 RepID=A0ABD3Q4U3_9STRA|eukprot:CCRYP_008629-RA/>CCRYP_008629-RA protein AED:0.36 eAED:0.36 QI:0/-1/0/1/-1/1/1/0/662
MVVSAEKARQKAEARRLRILAKANERLDVVSGLVPSNAADDKLNVDDAVVVVDNRVDSPSQSPRAADDSLVATTDQPDATPASPTASPTSMAKPPASGDEKENKGSRRMAAMRRRRCQMRAAKEEDEGGKAAGEATKEADAAAEVGASTAASGHVVAESEAAAVDETATESNEKHTVAPTDGSDKATKVNGDTSPPSIQNDAESKVHIQPSETIATPTLADESTSTEEPKKSYMGVAKMRRKILKQQKAARLQSITDSEAMQSDDHIERMLAAEMAAMGVTAKMVREGVDVVDSTLLSGSGVGIRGSFAKKKQRGWLALLFPPMPTVSRLLALVVLFGAGFRIGYENHSRGVAVDGSMSRSSGGGTMIYHVESTLTKPWEYGMGGRVAYLVGKMPTSPPTALPTGFNDDHSCIADVNRGEEECLATQKNKKKQQKPQQKEEKKDKQNQDHKLHIIDMEDEFDSGRAHSRPRGVTSEFDHDTELMKAPTIDPLFRVDLDDLLSRTSLPFPIDHAARFAIGFHRTWMYYLWSLPLSTVKTVTLTPKSLLAGWIQYPPLVLVFTLLVRLGTKVLLGGGKKSEDDGKSKPKDSKGFDVMGKVMESAKSYVNDSFPWAVFILGTLYDVVKTDMYVVFCGLLTGLVVPLHDFRGWWIGGGIVLGDGEL